MHAVMRMVGLFDRPASGDCLRALRQKPAIPGLTGAVVDLDETAWRHAVARLREVRLLAPADPSAPEALDAHPLVREWFGQRLERTHPDAWRAAHGRLFDICVTPPGKARHRRLKASRPSIRRSPTAAGPAGTKRHWTSLCGAYLPTAGRRELGILFSLQARRFWNQSCGDLLVLREAVRDAPRYADSSGPSLGAQ